MKILYSFPHKLGADRICYTAWQQVNGLAAAGADILLFPGVLERAVLPSVRTTPTLARGKVRIPYKVLGRARALALHDYIVSRRLEKLAGEVDIVHVWPMAARQTLKTAAKLGIPTVLERPNAHTRFAYDAVNQECNRIGVTLPSGHEYEFNADTLGKEEEEFKLADRLLCPSEFVLKTFAEQGFARPKLTRHQYGYDENIYRPCAEPRDHKFGVTMLFAGVCAVRKGLHFALEAWLKSSAHKRGTFLIAGEFLPAYREKLAPMLSHPSVKVLGFRKDIPELMRNSDILVLPSIEEGSALVTYEARGSGCVLLVSEASGAVCDHGTDGLVHRVGDVEALADHISLLDDDRTRLNQLRAKSLNTVHEITWTAAGRKLLDVYREVVASYRPPFSVRASAHTPRPKLSKI